jgi:DNA polymerase-3 subunit epsilon
MRAVILDSCGCFPSGRHYPGIAHLLRAVIRGIVTELAADVPWADLPIALIDVETTGRDPSSDRIVEIGIVKGLGGEVVSRQNWLVQPGIPIPEEARAVHGISDNDVKDAPRFEAIAAEVIQALEGCIPAAYNASFDKAFLTNELARTGYTATSGSATVPAVRRDVQWVDPLVWAREIHRDERSRALGEVAARLGVRLETAHRAADDAEAALKVLYALAADPRLPRIHGAFVQEQRRLSQLQSDERRFWKN